MTDTKNYHIFNGCHNCANMKDISERDTGNAFICLLQHPELMGSQDIDRNKTVDEFGTCDEWEAE